MRRDAREAMFKLTFEKLVSGQENNLTYESFAEELKVEDLEFFDFLRQGINSRFDFLKDVISGYVTTYKADRIYKVDYAIMITAAFEILFVDSVPDKVAVNEAIELAKKYSTDSSPSLVNGVLASVIKNKEETVKKYGENN
jgi:N utilization substance protein B